jgi:predicted Zn-dependent protease
MASRVEHFEALVRQQPDNALFRFSLAQALMGENHPAEAVSHLEFCVASRADWMVPRILLGKILLQLSRTAEANALFSEALGLAVDQHHEDPERELRALLGET